MLSHQRDQVVRLPRVLTHKLPQALDMLPTAAVAPTIAGPECFSDESFNAQPRP
ncbi:MAG: hypothetical protein IPL11_07195 [Candidatus Accumulibacter sp.]|nr:hypothetical protein [Accumulibacter sp.]